MIQFNFVISKAWHFLKALLWQLIYFPLQIILKPQNHWAMSGHRGRVFQDNSACLFQYISEVTDQKVYWITKNSADFKMLKSRGFLVLNKNTFRARLILSQAQVLIYSHGEDDLDSHFLYWNKLSGLRVYLNHCLNLTKTGQMAQKQVETMSRSTLAQFKKKITRFDYILASSETERQYFKQSFIEDDASYVLGGGAHLDQFFKLKNESENKTENESGISSDKMILYFPTFRDLENGRLQLSQILNDLVSDIHLTQWLRENSYQFILCHHINSQAIELDESVNDVFQIRPPSDIIELMGGCEVFISDYSGLIADYLVLNKAFVAFPFDLDEYLTHRSFYSDYRGFTYGHEVNTLSALIDLIITGKVFEQEQFGLHRNKLKEQFFPLDTADYSKRSFETISQLVENLKPPTSNSEPS